MEKEIIIDVKNSDITGDKVDDLVILKGKSSEEDNSYVTSLSLTVQDTVGGKQYSLDIDESGYNISIFLGDVNDDGKNEILIYGQKSGNENSCIGKVYELIEGQFRVIFNVDNFMESNILNTNYLDGYLAEIQSDKLKKKYIFYIGNGKNGYIDAVFDKESKVKSTQKPSLSNVNSIFPIINIEKNTINLVLQQKIIGITKEDVIGAIQSIISLKNNVMNLEEQNGIVLGDIQLEEEKNKNNLGNIKNSIGKNIDLIDLSEFGEAAVLSMDIDGDKRNEIICAYKENNKPCIAILREYGDSVKLLDRIIGEGIDIENIFIKPIRQKGINNIIVGWKTSSMWANLQVYEFKKDKIRKIVKEEKIPYSKLEVKKLDKDKDEVNEIILWSHDTGEAYDIKILTYRGDNLQRTYKYDKDYFEKVENYYKALIRRTRETPAYLYYLADAQLRVGKKIEANITIDKAINSNKPYPSLEELRRLKKKINN